MARSMESRSHHYILEPVCASALLKRNCSKEPLRSRHSPRIECDIQLETIPLKLSQVRCSSERLRPPAGSWSKGKPAPGSVWSQPESVRWKPMHGHEGKLSSDPLGVDFDSVFFERWAKNMGELRGHQSASCWCFGHWSSSQQIDDLFLLIRFCLSHRTNSILT